MRAVIVRASVAAALAAVVLGGILSWDRLGDSRAHLSDFHADRYAAIHERLPVSTFDRWRAQLGEGDRWWLDVPPGPSVGLTNRGAVHRTYALYWFLPALPAPSREEATDVFRRPHAGYEIYCIGPACP